MRKTCLNCRYFSPVLIDPASDFHIHYWCQYRGKSIVGEVEQNPNYFVEPIYDRIETGEHCCCYFVGKNQVAEPQFYKNRRI